MPNFGVGLRQARESLGVPIDAISAETRIAKRFLVAIEDEKFHLLPGGVFNRGFIRSYAECVGLDPARILAEYDALTAARDALQAPPPAPRRPRVGLPSYAFAVAGLALLIAVFYSVAPDDERSPTVPAGESTAGLPAGAAPLAELSAEPQTVQEQSTDAIASSPLVLELAVQDLTWIRLLADGALVESANLQPGTARRYTASSSINVSIGNAGGVVVTINGRPVGSLGSVGEVKEFVITRENASRIGG